MTARPRLSLLDDPPGPAERSDALDEMQRLGQEAERQPRDPTAAERQRRFRQRRKLGMEPIQVELLHRQIIALAEWKYLRPEDVLNPDAIAIAIRAALDDYLGG